MSRARDGIEALGARVGADIIGQRDVIERLLIGLLANGNLLIEGLPGLAKTRAVKSLAKNLDAAFSRIQFTPDLLPSDVTGSDIYDASTASFRFEPGPIFANMVLVDEINRAPAKVQAALLEAMEERQVTIGGTTHKMDPLFQVMATQNPIEQEGTYPLPEAQKDRFLMQVNVVYPPIEDEKSVMELVRSEEQAANAPAIGAADGNDAARPARPEPLDPQIVFDARAEIAMLHMDETVAQYIVDLVQATRTPDMYDAELAGQIAVGVSPRASIGFDRASRARAWLMGRDFVTPDDVAALAPDILRHRLTLSYSAEGAGVTADQVVTGLLERVAAP
ncbi:AAA family ATPase [Oceanomicrobium pacificus]|uniref:AAA domain-containing protein n=1 Tax=Oceanomicrobium pacificus TaxID=2692916 RepID=A0A6B0TN32_9RHOB|nr:AAA family ATPase [Oceanomicrobium pacificus]MXU65266.1 AAA domain-containing protein [Oceanomicrobium pacificus]